MIYLADSDSVVHGLVGANQQRRHVRMVNWKDRIAKSFWGVCCCFFSP